MYTFRIHEGIDFEFPQKKISTWVQVWEFFWLNFPILFEFMKGIHFEFQKEFFWNSKNEYSNLEFMKEFILNYHEKQFERNSNWEFLNKISYSFSISRRNSSWIQEGIHFDFPTLAWDINSNAYNPFMYHLSSNQFVCVSVCMHMWVLILNVE